jgi:hypothetical protein
MPTASFHASHASHASARARAAATTVLLLAAAGFTLPSETLGQSMHEQHIAAAADAGAPIQAGQAAFAAIAEVVAILEADPETDWSRVDIGALRDHLMDMDKVVVGTRVAARAVSGGVEMTVSGAPDVIDAARRMVGAHAAMVGAERGWQVEVQDRAPDVVVTWTTPRAEEVARLRALGFYGFLVDGSHHQRHHLMIAKGTNPHGAG